jgi:urease accessory protein
MDQAGGSLRVRGLHGHLALTATADSNGDTILRHQSFAAPVHISKPHRDHGWLVVNMASPSPGLLAGDHVDIDVGVESGAKLLLTAPSASRIHTMAHGESATVQQRFCVAAGAALDVWPEYVIPQSGACYRQKSIIHVADGGTLLWTESITPGRTAHGEIFAFREMRIATDIFWRGRQILRERYCVGAEHPSIHALRAAFPMAYYASVVCVSVGLAGRDSALRAIASEPADDKCWLGISQLTEGAWVVKILAADSPTLRAKIAHARAGFQTALGIVHPNLRRITGEAACTT